MKTICRQQFFPTAFAVLFATAAGAAGGNRFETPQRVSVFAEEANATSVGKAPLTRKAFRELDPFLVDPIEYAGQTDSFSVSLAAYPHATKRTLKEGVAFSWRDGELFGLFAEHPVSHLEVGVLSAKDVSEEEKKKRREEVRNTVDVLAALWIYSADSVLDLKRNLDKPLAVLELVAPAGPTKESVFAFDAYVPVGKVEFGGGTKMGGKAERARFFAEFLSDDPEREILCLGSLADGVAYVRDRVGARDDPAALRALDEKARTASAERWTALGVVFSEPSGVVAATSASETPAATASVPAEGFRPLPLDGKSGVLEKPGTFKRLAQTRNAFVLDSRSAFRSFDPAGLASIGYARSMASFPSVDVKELSKGIRFMLHDNSLVAVFLDHPPVQRNEERLRRTNFAYEAALYLYPMDSFLREKSSFESFCENPLAVLTIETSSSSPYPFFCAFTPEGHLNFCNCAVPNAPTEAARFFFEFLCEQPEKDVFCLGAESDNACIQKRLGNRIKLLSRFRASGDDPPKDSLRDEASMLMLDGFKEASSSLVKKSAMELWAPKGSAVREATLGCPVNRQRMLEEEVVIPGTSRVFDVHAFDAPKMRSLVLSEGIERIARSGNCHLGSSPGDEDIPLEVLHIPASLRRIDPDAFYRYRHLQRIDVSPGAPFEVRNGCLIDKQDDSVVFAFRGNDKIVVPDGVRAIGECGLRNWGVREIVLPEGVETIDENAIATSVERIRVPQSVKQIDDGAFGWCGSLSEIFVSKDNRRYFVSDGMLVDCRDAKLLRAFGPKTRFVVPDGVESIAPTAFSNLKQLESVVVPDSVVSIGSSAFANCPSLKRLFFEAPSFDLPDNVFGWNGRRPECEFGALEFVEHAQASTSVPNSLDAESFEHPVLSKEIPNPFPWPRSSSKTALHDRNSFRTFSPFDVGAIDYAKLKTGPASFPTIDFDKLSKGVQFMFRDGSLVALFLDHPPVSRDEERLRQAHFACEAALYLYPMDPFLTHGMSPVRSKLEPLAVLTVETSDASPHPLFCAFTAEGRLNFGNCAKPETPQDAARFFFEFLCENPANDVFCLGKEFDFENKSNGRIREQREGLTLKMLQAAREEERARPTDEEILKELRPLIDKAKADAPALAEKYGMVLWHAESDSHAEKESHAESAEKNSHAESAEVAEFESHAESAESAEVSNPRELNEEKQREQNERFGQDLQQLIDEDEEE